METRGVLNRRRREGFCMPETIRAGDIHFKKYGSRRVGCQLPPSERAIVFGNWRPATDGSNAVSP
eukprot:4835873-Prymnesium_polylepis.1